MKNGGPQPRPLAFCEINIFMIFDLLKMLGFANVFKQF